MISWLFNDLFVLGGELRHGAIRDPAKVTQEFSGGAGGGSSIAVTSFWKGWGKLKIRMSCCTLFGVCGMISSPELRDVHPEAFG